MAKMKKSDVDWDKVYRCCRKGRMGTIGIDEQEYVMDAYAADPKKYGEVARRARADVDNQMMNPIGHPSKEDE
jgi:hypothetical protein